MKILVHDFLEATAARSPQKVALIIGDREHTFGELARRSDRLAAALQSAGVVRGDRVALLLESSDDLVVSIHAVLKAGAVFVVLNPTAKEKKLAYVLNDCGARALIAQASLAPVVSAAAARSPALQTVIWSAPPATGPQGPTLPEIYERPSSGPADPGLIDHDLAAIIYTSGSTGEPKGVMLTHRNMTNTAWAISCYLENRPEDVVLCVLPLSFGYGLFQVIAGARVGYTVVLEKSFAFPAQILQRIQQHRVTGLPGVPTIFSTLLQMAPFRSVDLSSLRYITNAGAALPPPHIRRLQELFPRVALYSMYGLTECTRVSYLDPARLADKIDSVGKGMPNSEVYVVDEQGRRVAPGVVGELVIRGAHVMRGYWNRPRETAERIRDGAQPGEKVLHSGDLFRMDEDGFLYFVARKDDIFKCKGEKISPKEIESVIYALEAVAEAVVLGVDDPIEGQAIKAIIVPRAGATLTESMVRQHCRANLETYMIPKLVEIRDSLPKTDSGKIQRRST